MAAAELELLAAHDPVDGAMSADTVADLAASPWLRQDVHARGAYMSTYGLRYRCDHPELVLMNVPSGAVPWATGVLNGMAAYIDTTGEELRPGEIYLEEGPSFEGAYSFAELDGEAAESIGFSHIDLPFLRVIPMP
jgi:hypothetical protein